MPEQLDILYNDALKLLRRLTTSKGIQASTIESNNHNHRLENIDNVGINEVNIDVLDTDILDFKKRISVVKPLVFMKKI